jgi:transmembrane sensor
MNSASEFEAQAAAWLVRREAPDFTAQELAEFDAWADADPRHRAAYVRLEAAWRRADRLKRLRPLDGSVDEDLLATSPFARMEEYPARQGTRQTSDEAALGESVHGESILDEPALAVPGVVEQAAERPRRRWMLPLAAAAAVALVAVAAVTWFAADRTGWQQFSTDYGGFEKIVLDDGSVVHLNTNSVMRVHLTSELRQIVLDRGEALFKVAHDVNRPFDVQAGATTVRAVGTEFSVRLREASELQSGQRDVEVLVKEGRVAIDPPKKQLERAAVLPASVSTLSAGEAVIISAKRLHVEKVAEADVSRKLSWTEGRLWFERQRLADVVAEFNRYNRRQLVIADPAIADLRIGGGFEATDPESFVAALERTLGVRAFPSSPGGSEPDVIRLVGTQSNSQ